MTIAQAFEIALQHHQAGRLAEAEAIYRQVLAAEPQHADALHLLGVIAHQMGLNDRAVAMIRQAIALNPHSSIFHSNLGEAYRKLGQLDEAIAAYRQALQLQPDLTSAHNNLGIALKDHGQIADAIAAFRTALRFHPNSSVAHSNLLLDLHYPADLDADAIFREHLRWDEVHARPLANGIKSHLNDPDPDRGLRVGYVSPDFRDHSVSFFLENLLASHDRGQVEVFCYADLLRADPVTARLRQSAGNWREITAMSAAEAAELIRRDQIDILVDLAGHTALKNLLIFARKPAPVQVTYLGYCDTTGLSAMDYRFTDAQADPPGTTEHLHTEQLVRLPEVLACFRPSDEAPPVSPLPALARGQVTFASFHTMAKLNDRLLEHWGAILQQTPDSRLMMVASGLEQISTRQRCIKFFERHGIGAERLVFEGRVSLSLYLALHHEVDLLLDSHPFNGHTVSCHALWMGVPVVTLAGACYCSRMVASVLSSVGLPELIAHTPAAYVEIARALAVDRRRLAALRSGLRERMAGSPLMDAPRFARNVEQAYRQMWRTWCKQRSSRPTA